jgi:hypothetical protein
MKKWKLRPGMGVRINMLDVDIVGCQIGYGLPRGNVLVMPRCGDWTGVS